MAEILNGKYAKLIELALPITDSTEELLDTTTPDIIIDNLSVVAGVEVVDSPQVGDDKRVFGEGIQNAQVTLTIKAQQNWGSTAIYTLLEAIRTYPVSDDCDATGDRYFIKIIQYLSDGSTVAFGLEPVSGSWASCSIGDIDFPANDMVAITLTLQYGALKYTDGT